MGTREELLPYHEIATAAYSAGKTRIATKVYHSSLLASLNTPKLLDYEKDASKQVPLLLNMGEHSIALSKACERQDPDISMAFLSIAKFADLITVLLVVNYLLNKLPRPEFFRLIREEKLAEASFKNLAKKIDMPVLKMYNYQNDEQKENAMLALEEYSHKMVCYISI